MFMQVAVEEEPYDCMDVKMFSNNVNKQDEVTNLS